MNVLIAYLPLHKPKQKIPMGPIMSVEGVQEK
jgi:hypothetical protein